MKTEKTNHDMKQQTWYGNKGKIKYLFTQLFSLVTGYEFLFEETRKDI